MVHALLRRNAAVSSEPLRHDGTDHLPASGIEYGSVGGTSTFRGTQTTLDGGEIRPPSTMEPPQAVAEAASGAPPSTPSHARTAEECAASARTTAMLMAAGRSSRLAEGAAISTAASTSGAITRTSRRRLRTITSTSRRAKSVRRSGGSCTTRGASSGAASRCKPPSGSGNGLCARALRRSELVFSALPSDASCP